MIDKKDFEIVNLEPKHDGRKSFYGKAVVLTEGNTLRLRSYQTIVAEIKKGKVEVFGTYSNTTLRHIKEFLLQNGFKAESKKQIERDYIKSTVKCRSIKQSELTSECWMVQFRGLSACATCKFRDKPSCGGKAIREKLKNDKGFPVPLGKVIK